MNPRVALVIGASRGIGRQIAIDLSIKQKYVVAVAAKSHSKEPTHQGLPGTTFSVSEEITKAGGLAIPLFMDVRKEDSIRDSINQIWEKYERLDLIVYNAGAITWAKVDETPLKKFDLLNEVNSRGFYATVQEALPLFKKQNYGAIISVSPPIYSRFFKGKTPYAVTKVGMTVLTQGLAMELAGTPLSVCSIWPAKAIKSEVTNKMKVDEGLLRKPEIFGDAICSIAEKAFSSPETINGRSFTDEDYLRDVDGITDFSKYRCTPEKEPPRMLPYEFPSLLVKEENEAVILDNKQKTIVIDFNRGSAPLRATHSKL